MAKDLPYFKFVISEWNDGDVTLCSLEAQGLFINLCSIYWSQEGNMSLAKSKRRFSDCNATAWEQLINDKVIKVKGDKVIINFLDEQLKERGKLSNTNSENAAKGWEKRRNNATEMRPHTDGIEPACNIEEKRREEKIFTHNYDFNKKFALISNTPYHLPEDRGMNPVGRNIDEIVMQLKQHGFKDVEIYERTRAMKSIYAKQKLTFPVRVETFVESFSSKDWIKELQSLDPEKQAEQFQKNLSHANRKQPEPDTIGTSAPGSLG